VPNVRQLTLCGGLRDVRAPARRETATAGRVDLPMRGQVARDRRRRRETDPFSMPQLTFAAHYRGLPTTARTGRNRYQACCVPQCGQPTEVVTAAVNA
jgi:hypothetical protein